MYAKDDVKQVVEELGKRDLGDLVFGPTTDFDLGLDVFDPVSGEIITLARPRRRDIAQSEIFLTADQAASEISSLRMAKIYEDRAKGIVRPSNEAAKAAAKKAS